MATFYYYRKKNANKTSGLTIILLSFMLGILLMFTGCSHTTSVTVDDEQIRISGIIYGERIPIKQLNQVFLANTLPDITLRTNGLGVGPIRHGYFRSRSLGRNVKLFLHSRDAPFLYLIYGDNDKHVIVNFRDRARTLEVYEQLKELVKNE